MITFFFFFFLAEVNAGANKKPTTQVPARKLEADITSIDEEPEKIVPKTITPQVARAIQTARTAKGWTQAQLAQKINQKPQIINEYEQGKGVFNNQVLASLERQLGVKLRGKDVGQPIEPKVKKPAAK